MTEHLCTELIKSGLDEIIVGMDACNEETYRKIRIGGDFSKTVSQVEFLLKEKQELGSDKPRVVMQFIVMEQNEHEVEEFKSRWLSKQVVVKVRPKLGWGAGVRADNLNLGDSERTFPCPWLTRTVSIHWTGKLGQCDADFEGSYSPGDIRTQSIKEIWNGELANRRERHWAGDFSHELCRTCRDWQAGRSVFFEPEPEAKTAALG